MSLRLGIGCAFNIRQFRCWIFHIHRERNVKGIESAYLDISKLADSAVRGSGSGTKYQLTFEWVSGSGEFFSRPNSHVKLELNWPLENARRGLYHHTGTITVV